MTTWTTYKFSDFVNINPKVTLKKGVRYSFVEMKDLSEGDKFVLPSKKRELTGGSRFEIGDTLFARITPCLENGKICQVKGLENGVGFGSTEFLVFRGKAGVSDTNFVHYLSLSDEVRRFAEQNMVGTSGRQRVSWQAFENLTLNLPDLPTQTAIAEILSSLDDKIELNNKINQELENLAQTLFKQWFIDFEFPFDFAQGKPNENGEPYKSSGGEMVDSELGEIPKGWELKKLAELVKKSNTGADAIKRAPIVTEDTGIRCVRVGDMTNKRPFDEWGFCKITPEDYKRYKLEINDIIVTRTATLGINTIIRNEIKGVYNNGLIRLKMNEDKIIPLLAYCFFQSENYKIWIERISGDSSTRPNMQINYLLDFPMYLSPMAVQKIFIEQASDIFKCLENNILENKELTSLRDTLLPKLISGELEVSEALTQTTA